MLAGQRHDVDVRRRDLVADHATPSRRRTCSRPRAKWPGREAVSALGRRLVAVSRRRCSPAAPTPIGAGTTTQDQNFVAGDSAVTTWPAGDRTAAPTVPAKTLEGGSFDLGRPQGKVVVLNFWASWCAPCRVETPALQALVEATWRARAWSSSASTAGRPGLRRGRSWRTSRAATSGLPEHGRQLGGRHAGVPLAGPAGLPDHPGRGQDRQGGGTGQRPDDRGAAEGPRAAAGRRRRDPPARPRWARRSARPSARGRCWSRCRSRSRRASCRSCRRACCRWCPATSSYVTGMVGADLADARRGRMLLGACLFVLGFTVVFVVGRVGVRRARRRSCASTRPG